MEESPSPSAGTIRHNHASFEAAFARMVLGRLPHGHPFEWDFGAAIAKAARRLLQVRLAAVRQAAPGPGPRAARRPHEVDETEIPLRTKADPVCGGGGRSPQGKMLVAGAVEVENDAPGRRHGRPCRSTWVHRAFSNAKTWALGVYHGLRRQHLQSYLEEFVFRFNRRRTRHAAFRSLLAIALVRKPLTYNMLIMPEAQG